MFDVFEVKNGAMASQHNRLVEDLMAVVREKRGAVSLVAGSDAHTLGPLARVYTVAEAETVSEFLQKIRTGQCFVWGSEMGFRVLLSDVYRMVFRYYGSVLDWKNPEFTRGEKARHLALAAIGAPISAAGVPLAITSLNYVKQIFVSRSIARRLIGRTDFTGSAWAKSLSCSFCCILRMAARLREIVSTDDLYAESVISHKYRRSSG